MRLAHCAAILLERKSADKQTYNDSGGPVTADVRTLTRLINDEVIIAMGLKADGWLGQRLQPILARATRRFCEIFREADQIVGERGLVAGSRFLLLSLVKDFRARGTQNVPCEGPLVIASNHPGTVDSVTLIASAGREDLKVIASGVPFLKNLVHIREHLILLPRQGLQARMLVVRDAIRHLKSGGALLLFARGGIDPDPAFMTDGDSELLHWSHSLDVFLERVPGTRVVTSIVSNVIEPGYMHHPLTWLQRARPDRQRLAMMIQLMQQMLGTRLEIVPRVSFGKIIDPAALHGQGCLLPLVTDSARDLMKSHLAWQA